MAIDKLPSGKWRARIYRNGERKSKTFDTKYQAQEWLGKTRDEHHAQLVGKPVPKKTFGDLLKRYVEEVSPSKRGEMWEVKRVNALLRSDLSAVELVNLRPEHFAQWRDRRLQEVSPSTVARDWTLMSAACTTAVKEWGWLPINIMTNVKRPKVPPPRDRRISDDEIEKILFVSGYERDSRPETVQSRVGVVFLFAIETAMRAGEICGLTWRDIDLKKRVAHLEKTKNGYARDVPLSKEAMRLIGQMKKGKDGDTVFGINTAQLDALFRHVKERANIDGLHFHDSRREALTRLAAKVDVMTLAKISGHRDLRILQNVYYSPNMADVAKLLD